MYSQSVRWSRIHWVECTVFETRHTSLRLTGFDFQFAFDKTVLRIPRKKLDKYSSTYECCPLHLGSADVKRKVFVWTVHPPFSLASVPALLPSTLSLSPLLEPSLSLLFTAVTVTVFRGTAARWIFLWPLSSFPSSLPSLSLALKL